MLIACFFVVASYGCVALAILVVMHLVDPLDGTTPWVFAIGWPLLLLLIVLGFFLGLVAGFLDLLATGVSCLHNRRPPERP